MVLKKWRQRRQSVRELRQKDAEMREEYNRLREMDRRIKEGMTPTSSQPPSYDQGISGSGESVFGSTASEAGAGGRPRMSGQSSQMSGSTR